MKKVHVHIIIRKSIDFLLIASLLTGCTDRSASNKNDAGQQKATAPQPVQYKKPPASFNDTLIITGISAVFYNPDSLQLDKIGAISKRENYDTEVHNCFYLMQNARRVLKKYWSQIHVIETKTTRYLLFIKNDRNKTCIDLNSNGDMCGIYLFDGRKEPELADMMNIDTAIGFYFAK